MGRFKIWRGFLFRNDSHDLENKFALADRMLQNASYTNIDGYAKLSVSLKNLDIKPTWDVDLTPGFDEKSKSMLVVCILVLVIEDENKAALFRLWNPEYVVL